MWLFTTEAHLSIVEHKDDPNYLLVRSRAKGDIEKHWPNADVQRTEDADFLYRAKISRFEVAAELSRIIESLNYPSYKGAIKDKGRYWQYYAEINETLQTMQDRYMENEYENG